MIDKFNEKILLMGHFIISISVYESEKKIIITSEIKYHALFDTN